ncbi:hypothetical protein I309_03050 [Cryptococcus deuterogattii LA55]|nr:hypothetical protein I309_03050 [Cryptococcus deuterogattii LA55]KIR32602.1 hypothetical protein I352_05027 [Cryptococcus deuterogattii MMRL2647]KIR70679.1 hypothetical protein I310_05530 [Cryptococcus deuterogattii CA1014]KIR90742.1 hypothetical protein I304_05391 [Cryptococcus deuterogattii CBS 10090]KIR97518.1 hypothetical protein L804_05205 [Cryptococcus deuterogattii 2001/935-1]
MAVFPMIQNKIDISQMNEQDQKAFKLYGKIPGKNLLTKMQKERKYFDSGDYMMSKAGVPTASPPGTAHPTPEAVPHASPPSGPGGYLSSSPTGGSLPSPSILEHGVGGEKPAHSVGVGISPAATSEAIEMPGHGHHHGQQRRGSESRISPPNTWRESVNPSSFPIHHPGILGGSPVKASSLAKRVDEEGEQ